MRTGGIVNAKGERRNGGSLRSDCIVPSDSGVFLKPKQLFLLTARKNASPTTKRWRWGDPQRVIDSWCRHSGRHARSPFAEKTNCNPSVTRSA